MAATEDAHMNSFLITFKPASESPKRGWPIEKLRRLVTLCKHGEISEEPWRFQNRKNVSLGNRIFLLLQGKRGPAIIGYGATVGPPSSDSGKWRVPIRFETLVDPTTEVLADREDISNIDADRSLWSTQESGRLLPNVVAIELERLVVGNQPKPKNEESVSNPDWTRDELILALDVYLKYRPNHPGKGKPEIIELSRTMNQLGKKLFPPEMRARTFPNVNSVYMKLMNFRRFDPQYTLGGKGLNQGAQLEEEVWNEFADDPIRCQQVAEAIRAAIKDSSVGSTWTDKDMEDGMVEAAEGRILTRLHISRERNRNLGRVHTTVILC